MSNEYDGANAYAEFLSSKFRFTQNHGFTVSRPDLNPLLKPHQADVVCWNVLGALPATFMTLAPGSHHPDVWHDVNRMITLNGEQTQRGLVNHICPLQVDLVDRLIRRYSNEGESVYDPFAGLMTVPYRAIKLGRFGRGAELSAEYFRDGLRYLRAAELEMNIPTLFDLVGESDESAAVNQ